MKNIGPKHTVIQVMSEKTVSNSKAARLQIILNATKFKKMCFVVTLLGDCQGCE